MGRTIIERLDEPPHEIIDISLATSAKPIDVCSLLHSFYGSPFNDDPLHIMLEMLSKECTSSSNIKEISSMLCQLIDLLQLENSTEWIEQELMYLSDAYKLAALEIDGDLQQVENNIKNFLQAFNV